MGKLTVYEGSENWSALYVDGQLDQVGDHSNIEERIQELCEVEKIQSDDFLRGGHARKDVAPTLDDLNAYTIDRLARQNEADELRARARELLAQAEEMTR